MSRDNLLSQEGMLLLNALCGGIMGFSQVTGQDPQFALAHTKFWQKIYPGWHPDMLVSIYGVRARAYDDLPVGTVLFSPTLRQLKSLRTAFRWECAIQKPKENPPAPAVIRRPADERGSGKILAWRPRE